MRVEQSKLIEVGFNEGELLNSQAPTGRFAIETNCGDVIIVNQSAVTVSVGQMPLPAGASITFGVNAGEIQTQPIYVITPNPVTNSGVYVFKKRYM